MADLRASGLGGVPKGATADRPSSPSIGDVFYNGTLGCLEIYTSQGWVASSAPPGIPTIGSTTNSGTGRAFNNGSASVAFTAGEGGGLPNSYRATSNPGGFSTSSSSSPIVVSGLQSGVSYTFSITGTNNFGTSAASANSSSITATTVPDAPVIGSLSYVSNTSLSLAFTAGSTGGSSITNYKYSTDGTNYTTLSPAQTTTPLTLSGLTASTNYAFYIKAVNANGDSVASSISNNVFTGTGVSGGTLTSDSTYYYRTFTGTGNLVVSNTSLANTDILTVAGAGAGGWDVGGGGGAGGLTYSSSITLPATTYTVTIGAGGASPVAQAATSAASGTSTSIAASGFSTITSIGGGGGGNYNGGVGASGGSGGGGSGYTGGQLSGGSGTQSSGSNYTGYGYGGGAGRADLYGNQATGGGGGGAGGTGSSSTNNLYSFASGGPGLTYFGSTYAAGGKGGGDQWTGTVAGAVNTGNGGDGHGQSQLTTGGSGIVIVRYLKSAVGG